MSLPSRRRLLALAPGAFAAAWTLSPRRGRAEPWVDRLQLGPLEIVAAFPLAPWSDAFGDLDGLEPELRRTLALPAVRSTVEVFLLADEGAHRRTLAELYPQAPYRRALYVQRGGRGAVYAYRHEELAVDLRHECTHALLHAALPAVPLWLDEGLAEYFEPPEAERAFGHPHLAELRWNLRLGMMRAIEALEAQEDLHAMDGLDYRFAWAWVHFMLHGPIAAHRTLVDYVAQLGRGGPPAGLAARLRAATPELDARFIDHFKHWRR